MFNCPPSSVRVAPSSNPCRSPTICPHCWGRAAIDHWRAVDRALFGKPRKGLDPRRQLEGLAIVTRVLAVQAPFKGLTGRATLPDLLDRRLKTAQDPAWDFSTSLMPTRDSDLRFLRKAGARGGFEILVVKPVRVDPTPILEGHEAPPCDGLRVEVRQVIAVPLDALEGFLAHPRVEHPALLHPMKAFMTPTRGRLALAIAYACRYPRYLLQGDRRFALAAYRARKGRRLSTRFGSCHGGSR